MKDIDFSYHYLSFPKSPKLRATFFVMRGSQEQPEFLVSQFSSFLVSAAHSAAPPLPQDTMFFRLSLDWKIFLAAA